MDNRSSRASKTTGTSPYLLLALGYAALLIYGTLYPFADWSRPDYEILARLFSAGLYGSRTDFLVNLLVYLPFGLLLFKGLPIRYPLIVRLLAVTAIGGTLSLSLEYLQAYAPARVPSLLDLILNTVGTFGGALLGRILHHESRLGSRLLAWRQQLFKPGAEGNLGLLVTAFWALSQLTPLVPSFDVGHLWDGIKPLWMTLTGREPFLVAKAAVYAGQVAAISLLLERTLNRSKGHSTFSLILLLVGVVVALKVPVFSRSLSLEAVTGLAVGLLLAPLMSWTRRRDRTYAAMFLILAALAIEALQAPTTPSFHAYAFNWTPFHGHLSNELIGFAGIIDAIWPFLALSLAVQLSYRSRPSRAAPITGGILVFLFVFVLEWLQQAIPGRYPDITTAVLALLGWSAPWVFAALDITRGLSPRSRETRRYVTRPLWVAGAFAGLSLATGLTTLAFGPTHVIETRVDQSKLPTHRESNELPPVSLPAFRYAHPRLPAPSAADVRRLQEENPSYLKAHKKRARGGTGKVDSAVIVAIMEPGSVDLNTLHRRLMAQKFQWRGHQQGKPLAVAYDWLYSQWSEEQRAQLRRKLIEGGHYLMNRIRDDRLSPYNVYLYNSPFQTLVAISLAIYGDTPEAEPIMRFTADFWKNRTLPVWRQVMGENGGWHEGGEYVGIGIGQAVYQVPAMWRAATGEDLFDEPGIRGFLDFLVYRTRPDGTHMRWGDGANHDRLVPDRIPLAIELRHAAAYSLGSCPKRIEPTSWPWGPLPDDSLCDPTAIERLPLTRYFDGIGLLVARSGWGKDATYLTFKAGDNYWSHSHLDQGAFTLFKGDALAIDSGVYMEYGSDHHLNYAYQTIAHNVVTVTDPDDTVPKPVKNNRPPRPIANDGGQRRVGSGWGVEAAPIDLAEWERKKDIYHTGAMLNLATDSDLVGAVADLAPAYTNKYSGQGTFSHRTHRVAAYVRTLGFDPQEEIIVIHDRVQATNPAFYKKWLLHSIQEPVIDDSGFSIRIGWSEEANRLGGDLLGTVLLPRQPYLSAVGGDGLEYFVNGVNYLKGAEDWKRKRPGSTLEPGAWRIHLSPSVMAKEDRFLVVLIPRTDPSQPLPAIRLLDEGSRYGCEIVGGQRTTRWWFDESHDGPLVEIINGSDVQTRDLRVAKRPPLEVRSNPWAVLTTVLGLSRGRDD